MTHARVTKDSSLENNASNSHCECAEERCSTSWNFINVGLANQTTIRHRALVGEKAKLASDWGGHKSVLIAACAQKVS